MVAAWVNNGAQGTYAGGEFSTSESIGAPTGIAAGDILLCVLDLWSPDPGTVTMPTGWAQLGYIKGTGGSLSHFYCWKRATSSEPASYTFSWVATSWGGGVIHRFTGAKSTGDPWGGTLVGAFSSALTVPSITYSNSGPGLGIWTYSSQWDNAVLTTPTGYVKRLQFISSTATLATRTDAAGTLTTGTATVDANDGDQIAAAVTLLDEPPASTGGGEVAYAGSSTAPNYVGDQFATSVTLDRTTGTMGTTAAGDLLVADLHLLMVGLSPLTLPAGWSTLAATEATSSGGGTGGTTLWSEPWSYANGVTPSTVIPGLSGTGSTVNVQGNRLRLTSGSATGGPGKVSRRAVMTAAADVEVRGSITMVSGTGDYTATILARGDANVDTTNGYGIDVRNNGGTITWQVVKAVSASYTFLLPFGANGLTATTGTEINYALRISGASIKAKLWTGTVEPGAWQYDATDSSPYTPAGTVGWAVSSTSGTAKQVDVGPVTITTPVTAVADTFTQVIAWKRATGSEPTTYTFAPASGAGYMTGVLHRFTGAVTTGSPFGGHGTRTGEVGNTIGSIFYTAAGPGLGFWMFNAYNGNQTVTPPSGYTARNQSGPGSLALATRTDVAGARNSGTGSWPDASAERVAIAGVILGSAAPPPSTTVTNEYAAVGGVWVPNRTVTLT